MRCIQLWHRLPESDSSPVPNQMRYNARECPESSGPQRTPHIFVDQIATLRHDLLLRQIFQSGGRFILRVRVFSTCYSISSTGDSFYTDQSNHQNAAIHRVMIQRNGHFDVSARLAQGTRCHSLRTSRSHQRRGIRKYRPRIVWHQVFGLRFS